MKLAAFIFCLLGTITMGWMLIPLIWCIPLTIKAYKVYKGEASMSTGAKVCTLLFVSLIGGILLLCDKD